MIKVIQGDITTLAVDAIVNAANQVMLGPTFHVRLDGELFSLRNAA